MEGEGEREGERKEEEKLTPFHHRSTVLVPTTTTENAQELEQEQESEQKAGKATLETETQHKVAERRTLEMGALLLCVFVVAMASVIVVFL